ncbi:MAG TPA: hypothetical protein VG102_01830 [Candidatus Paceibacterota bacterium]|jgi:hypothetical protein|nr:hypothetical protein [Candidatus Paceibacterota bacterium]
MEGKERPSKAKPEEWKDFPQTEPQLEIITPTDKGPEIDPSVVGGALEELNREDEEERQRQDEVRRRKERLN